LTNYTVNGVEMPSFTIIGTEGGIPPVPVQLVTWQGQVYWGAQYLCVVALVPYQTTIGYAIEQPIPINTALIGQYDYGIAGMLTLNITPWWLSPVDGQTYAYSAICITS
jgi:hypothetical protein